MHEERGSTEARTANTTTNPESLSMQLLAIAHSCSVFIYSAGLKSSASSKCFSASVCCPNNLRTVPRPPINKEYITSPRNVSRKVLKKFGNKKRVVLFSLVNSSVQYRPACRSVRSSSAADSPVGNARPSFPPVTPRYIAPRRAYSNHRF